MDTYHEMDDHGNHRIVVNGQASRWVDYRSLPGLEINGVWYLGASAYWEGHLPIEKVLALQVVSEEA